MTPSRVDHIRISLHATQRYQKRVDPSASTVEARRAIRRILRRGHATPKPRHWTRETRLAPGSVFVYCAERPGVVLVLTGRIITTVITRALARLTRRADRTIGPRRKPPDSRRRWPTGRLDYVLDRTDAGTYVGNIGGLVGDHRNGDDR